MSTGEQTGAGRKADDLACTGGAHTTATGFHSNSIGSTGANGSCWSSTVDSTSWGLGTQSMTRGALLRAGKRGAGMATDRGETEVAERTTGRGRREAEAQVFLSSTILAR